LSKPRNIDYSTEEMAKCSGITVKNFIDRLKSICDEDKDNKRFGYDLSLSDFKTDELNETSDYFFPPEIAEPLIILIKNYDNHPYHRKNAKKNEVTASMISNYTKKVLDDIDNIEYDIFKKIIYGYNAHVTSLKLSYWVDPFIRELTHFILNSLQQHEDIGQALYKYTKQLNSFNYNLHRGMSIKQNLNVEGENVSIDHLLVRCIKTGLQKSKHIKELCFPDLNELIKAKEFDAYPDEFKDKFIAQYSNLSIKEKRNEYLNLMLRDSINQYAYTSNLKILEASRRQAENWRPYDKRIAAGDNGIHIEEMKNYLLGEISKCDSDIKQAEKYKELLQKWLNELKNTGNCSAPFCFESADFIKIREADYIEHCKKLDEDTNNISLTKVLDNMVGQALRHFIDNPNE